MSPEQRENQILNNFINNQTSLWLLLDGINVTKNEEDIFIDAIFSTLWDGVITVSEYKVIRKYIWDENFLQKYEEFLNEQNHTLQWQGFLKDDLKSIWAEIKNRVDTIISRFDIYQYAWDDEGLRKNYWVICESKFWTVVVARTWSNTYLYVNECYYSVDKISYNSLGEPVHMLFYFPDHTIHVDMKWAKVNKLQGLAVGLIEREDLNWLISQSADEEILTILETGDVLRHGRKWIMDDATLFQDIFFLDDTSNDVWVTYLSRDFSISEMDSDDEDGIWKIRSNYYQNIYSTKFWDIIFSTTGFIKWVFPLKWETYIIEQLSEFDTDYRTTWYMNSFINVYGVLNGENYMEWIPEKQKPQFIPTHDNLTIVNIWAEDPYIYSSRDKSMIDIQEVLTINNYTLNGKAELQIEFVDADEEDIHCYDTTDDLSYDKDEIMLIERNYH